MSSKCKLKGEQRTLSSDSNGKIEGNAAIRPDMYFDLVLNLTKSYFDRSTSTFLFQSI